MLTAKGRNGEITFDGKTITITRDSFFGRMSHGRSAKTIPLAQITAVQFKPWRFAGYGWLAFTIPGTIEQHAKLGQRSKMAAEDENTVTFYKRQQADMEAVRDAVNTALAERV